MTMKWQTRQQAKQRAGHPRCKLGCELFTTGLARLGGTMTSRCSDVLSAPGQACEAHSESHGHTTIARTARVQIAISRAEIWEPSALMVRGAELLTLL